MSSNCDKLVFILVGAHTVKTPQTPNQLASWPVSWEVREVSLPFCNWGFSHVPSITLCLFRSTRGDFVSSRGSAHQAGAVRKAGWCTVAGLAATQPAPTGTLKQAS